MRYKANRKRDIFDAMRQLLLFVLVTACQLVLAQEKTIQGKVVVPDATAEGVLVLNLTNEKETYTDSIGRFTLPAQLDDVLIFHAPHLDKMRKLIDEEAYAAKQVIVPMTSKVIELDEVTVTNYSHLNAYDLGITETRIKPLTAAQRGRYRSEAHAEKYEKNLELIERLEADYDVEYLEQKLSIPKGHAKGFLFFAVEQPWFAGMVRAKNKSLTKFYLIALAERYNALQNEAVKQD